MEDICKRKGTVLIIRLPAELDHPVSEQIRLESDEIMEEHNILQIDFDFRKTTFMDSSGIGLIMGRFRRIAPIGGKVRIIHAGERMQKILAMSGVTRVIEVEPERGWV
ncbi:MAG: anti-sigma factor antagonist [Fusicatenibacter sp.]|nr:anti-sigma factor antagonist [Lachnospiraceae bacterium]MDY2937217.1 anti-sigma factor antagonist [Fusicatenibacter sp.]